MLLDGSGRVLDYLRIAVTDRCNLACRYCQPDRKVARLPRGELLSFEEIAYVASAFVSAGARRIRLTGGEPLMRRGLPVLASKLSHLPGLEDLSLTTNGILLSRFARPLAQAGVRRVNVSVDSLDPRTFTSVTGGGKLELVLDGLQAALEAGMEPVKLNVVLLRGISDDPGPFVRLAREQPVHVRFIELMDLGSNPLGGLFVAASAIERALLAEGLWSAVSSPGGVGPARYYRQQGMKGSIGFITPYSRPFCPSCNRLRLTAQGRLLFCLFSREGLDLKEMVRGGCTQEELIAEVRAALPRKPADHARTGSTPPGSALRRSARPPSRKRVMSQIGG